MDDVVDVEEPMEELAEVRGGAAADLLLLLLLLLLWLELACCGIR
jgi:hypothetical protein